MVTWDMLTLPNATWKADVRIRAGFWLVLRVQTEFSLTIHFSCLIFKLTADYAA